MGLSLEVATGDYLQGHSDTCYFYPSAWAPPEDGSLRWSPVFPPYT